MSTLAFRKAREHVQMFANQGDDLLSAHGEAMEAYDCEAVIQIGIDAYQWLTRADQALHQMAFTGSDIPEDDFEKLRTLYRDWLVPCGPVKDWASSMLAKGFELENFAKLSECEREVAAIVRSFEKDILTEAMRTLRDEAITEHERGETACHLSSEEQDDLSDIANSMPDYRQEFAIWSACNASFSTMIRRIVRCAGINWKTRRKGSMNPGSWSVSITMQYRAIYFVGRDGRNVWYWIGTHADYDAFTGNI